MQMAEQKKIGQELLQKFSSMYSLKMFFLEKIMSYLDANEETSIWYIFSTSEVFKSEKNNKVELKIC